MDSDSAVVAAPVSAHGLGRAGVLATCASPKDSQFYGYGITRIRSWLIGERICAHKANWTRLDLRTSQEVQGERASECARGGRFAPTKTWGFELLTAATHTTQKTRENPVWGSTESSETGRAVSRERWLTTGSRRSRRAHVECLSGFCCGTAGHDASPRVQSGGQDLSVTPRIRLSSRDTSRQQCKKTKI